MNQSISQFSRANRGVVIPRLLVLLGISVLLIAVTQVSNSAAPSGALSFVIGSVPAEPAPAPAISCARSICPIGCDYLTIKAAISDVQANGLDGPLVLELGPTYLSTGELLTGGAPITFTNFPGISATNTLTLRPQSGATNLIITGDNPTAIIDLNNVDFVTIDGRPGGVGAAKELTIENTSLSAATVRLIGGADNNTIKYTSLKGATTGAAAGVVTFSAGGTNNNNTVDNCDIHGSGVAMPANGVYAGGGFLHSGNTISNCNIFNFYHASADASGVRIDGGSGTAWTITGNSFYQTSSRTGSSSTVRAIYLNVGSSGNNFTVSNNVIGGSMPNADGSAWTIIGPAASYRFVGIQINVSVSTPSSVQGNTVKNFSWLSTNLGFDEQSSLWNGIHVTAGSVNIGTTTGNTIGGNTGTGSVLIARASSGLAGLSFGIVVQSNGTVLISNNNIGSITTTGSDSFSSASLVGIQVSDIPFGCSFGGCENFKIFNNTIGSTITANSFNASNASTGSGQEVTGIRSSGQRGASITGNTIANLNNNFAGSASTGSVRGIATSTGPNTITANTVSNLSTASQNINSTTAQSAYGIVQTSTSASQTISQNVVHSITNTSSSGSVWVTGIYCVGQTFATNIIERNLVHSLAVASTSASSAINGIQVAAGAFRVQNNMVRLGLDASGSSTASASFLRGIYDNASSAGRNFYNNSIYIGGNQTAGAANSFAFFSSGSNNLRIFRNNIFLNGRSNAGSATGKPYAAGYGGVGFNPAGLTSNHNIFFVSGAGGVLGIYGGADRTTLSAWQSAHGQDSSSAFVDPLFVSPNAGTPDLHLQASNPAEGSGIVNAFVIDDFDGETRSSLTPTDVGADAGNFTLSSDAFAPVISYPILSNGSTSNRVLIGFAAITDNVGVADSPNRPRLYYKKSTDADAFVGNTSADNGWKFVTAGNSTSPYDFTIDYSIINGGSVVAGDTIQYFVVAQDAANNFSSKPVGAGSSASPPVQNINARPVEVNSYNILTSISGTRTVCAAGPPTCDYLNLTGAGGIFADINSKVVAGNLTVNIVSNLTEDGTNGLNHIASNEFPQPTVTIQPADGTLKTISGSVQNTLIRLNGADSVTVDGRFSSTGRFLLFRNTFGQFPALSLQNDSSNNTIRSSIIQGASTSGSLIVFGTGATTGNDNNTLTDNIVRDAGGPPFNLIVSNGTSSTIANSGNTISNNELFNFTGTAIFIQEANSGNESWTIQGNNIYQTVQGSNLVRGIDFSSNGTNIITENTIRNLNTSNSATGITLDGAFNTLVSSNRIFAIPSTSGSQAFLTGIEFTSNGLGTSVTLVNNQITIIPSFTNNQTIRGIYDNAGPGSTFNAYYNSVLVGGTATGLNPSFACLRGGPPPSAHTFRNNICFNNRTGGTGNHFAAGRNTTTGIFSSDYNLFVGTGSTPENFMAFGDGNAAGIPVSFAQWQAGTGGDANSQAGNPGGNFTTAMFVNPAVGDLHIVAAGNPLVSNTGTPVPGVTTDYDNETRDTSTPDLGSDEINPIPPDTTPPNVLFIDDADADNAVFTNTAMTYTVAFNEDINAATLTGADFENTGTSTISIGTITETSAQSGVFTVQVTPTSPGTLILRVRSDNVIADGTGNNLASSVDDDSTITVSSAADIQISSHTDSPDPVFDDELITYTIGFINNGPTEALSATVSSAIPANTSFFSASTSSSGWSRTDATPVGGTGNIVFSNPSAPVGVTASFTLVLKVNSGTSTGTLITNTAMAASSTFDPMPGNNSLSAFTNVVQSLALVVNDAGDAPDNNVGNGICDTSAAPEEQCTLRAAIQESNTTADFDTIGFAPALSGSTILLNNALDPILSNVSITGPGANLLTVKRSESAAARFRIFTINSGKTVSISGLTVTNGSTADGTDAPAGGMGGEDGGGILNLGTLTLTGIVITGNRTGNGGNGTNPGFTLGGPGGEGGGISSSGSLTMTNVTVANNLTGNGGNAGHGGHGGLGGGVHVSGTMTMTSSSVTGNTTGIGGVGSEAGASGGSGGLGGGMYVQANGTFTMTLITVTGNNTGDGAGISGAGGHGGGIAYDSFVLPTGSASLINSTVNNNTTGDASAGVVGQAGFGGGIFSVGTLTIIGSTINGNATGFNGPGGGGVGGGIDNSGTLTMTNTTVSGNSTGAEGGTGAGLWNARTANLTNCTIVFNSSFATFGGAGIHQFNSFSVVNIGNTIVAGNSLSGSPNGSDVDNSFAYNSQGNNLVGNGEGSSGFTQPGDQVGTGLSPLNPGLGPLANNGGPTMTHALLLNSPAIDKGNNELANAAGLTTDQRGPGFLRILDGADPGTIQTVDIGAFEAGPAIEDITDKTTSVNTPLSVIFNIGDASLNPTVTASSANTTLVPNTPANINVTGSGSSRTLNITPALNQVGTSVITVTVTSGGNSMSDTFTLTVTPAADLEIISKSDTPDPAVAGSNITYAIEFRNNGPNDSLDVQVRENIPTNTVFVSAAVTNGTGWTFNDESCCTSSIFFYKAKVANGETATFTVVLKVLANTPSGSVITNQVVAGSFDPGFTPDPPPNTNNMATATTDVVTSADLSVVKTGSPDPVVAGQDLTYTITVSNSGPSDAQNLSLSDPLPASTTLVSFTVPNGWTRTDLVPVGGAGTVTATAPTLATGANAVFSLVVKVNAATPLNTVLTNSATATSTTSDPNGDNNTGTDTTAVASHPDLTITKTHAGDFAQGQTGATYTITVSNSANGPTNGSTVTVTDTVPVGLTPTGPVGAHNGWTCSIMGQTLTCTRSDVLAGNSGYPAISLTVTVANPAPLTVTNTATVSGGGEQTTNNNSASDMTSINCIQDFSLNNASPLMISRFRMNGPAGPQDEFVQIYNPSGTAHTVASGNCAGGGYGVFASSGNGTISNGAPLVCFIPNGTLIPAGGYYLCTGATYSLSNLGHNGGVEGATSVGDAPIGCNGLCAPEIPDDAGLALMNVSQGLILTPAGGFQGGVPDAGFILYDKVGFGPYGAGAPAPGYPALAPNFCEGAACLKPVGDASTGGACINSSGLFPVFPAPPACYGHAGQYEFLRRQTAFDPALGTVHQDTNISANDWILVAPNSAVNMGVVLTGVSGVTALHGAAAPQGSTAPADFPSVNLKQAPFDLGATQLGAPNAERNFGLDPTVVDPANNPGGTFALRLRFTNNSGSPITGLRFRVDHISTLCGAQAGTPTTGSGGARNLSAAPDCGTGSLTAILKLLNSVQEVVIDSTTTAHAVLGTVVEDLSASATPTPPGAGALSPQGGGLDNSLVINPSSDLLSVGDGVTGGTGVFATAMSTSDPNNVIRIRIKFGVVRSGRFILLITPAAKTAP